MHSDSAQQQHRILSHPLMSRATVAWVTTQVGPFHHRSFLCCPYHVYIYPLHLHLWPGHVAIIQVYMGRAQDCVQSSLRPQITMPSILLLYSEIQKLQSIISFKVYTTHCMINTSCHCSACLMHQFISHNRSFLQCTLLHVRSKSLNLPVTKLPLARRTDQVGVKGHVGLSSVLRIVRHSVSDQLGLHLRIYSSYEFVFVLSLGDRLGSLDGREDGFPQGEWVWHLDLSPRAVEGWGSLRLVKRWPGWAGGVAWEGCGGHRRRMLLGRDGRVNRLRRGRTPYSALVKSQGNPHLCIMMLLALKIIVIAAIV